MKFRDYFRCNLKLHGRLVKKKIGIWTWKGKIVATVSKKFLVSFSGCKNNVFSIKMLLIENSSFKLVFSQKSWFFSPILLFTRKFYVSWELNMTYFKTLQVKKGKFWKLSFLIFFFFNLENHLDMRGDLRHRVINWSFKNWVFNPGYSPTGYLLAIF